MDVLVTGGAGYIGSHACKAIAAQGWKPIVVDNLSTGHRNAVRWGDLHVLDIRDSAGLSRLIRQLKPAAVMHFAASAYVGESVEAPLEYYDNNLRGTLSLLQACVDHGVSSFVFSSSCAVYGLPASMPITESMDPSPINPYGETKLACERLLRWTAAAHGLRWTALRYFNVAGADPAGEIGERHDPETHLVPLAFKAVRGEIAALSIHGGDYPTADGSAIRDYVHVCDIASAHVAAVSYLLKGGKSSAANLGTGRGYSVREVIQAVERVTGHTVPHGVGPRRPGDPPELWADAQLAGRLLEWTPQYKNLEEIIASAWRWEQQSAAR